MKKFITIDVRNNFHFQIEPFCQMLRYLRANWGNLLTGVNAV